MHDLRTGQKPDEVAREKGHDGIANDILAYPDGPFEAISEKMDTDAAAARWDDAHVAGGKCVSRSTTSTVALASTAAKGSHLCTTHTHARATVRRLHRCTSGREQHYVSPGGARTSPDLQR